MLVEQFAEYAIKERTAGAFGAAAAVATILGCNRAQFAYALATATTFACGLQQAYRTQAMTKLLHSGHAAEVGAMAAMAAAKGVTGALNIIEGQIGFGAVMCDDPDWAKATRDLGVHYNIVQMTFKNHGCCGHTFAPIDGALYLQKIHGFTWRDIKRVRIATYKAGTDIVNNPSPEGDYRPNGAVPGV